MDHSLENLEERAVHPQTTVLAFILTGVADFNSTFALNTACCFQVDSGRCLSYSDREGSLHLSLRVIALPANADRHLGSAAREEEGKVWQ